MNFKVKEINVDTGKHTIILNEKDAKEIGVRSLDRVKMITPGITITAVVETTTTVVKEGEVRLSLGGDDAAANAREVKSGELLDGAAIARSDPHAVTATATALNTRLLAIPVDAVRALIASEPDVGDRLTTS